MTAILLRFLPHGLVVLAIIAAVWWIDDAGRPSDERQDTRDREMMTALRIDLRGVEARLVDRIGAIDGAVAGQIGAIDTLHTTVVQPTLIKELSRETRFRDPVAGITERMRGEINRAIAGVVCAPRPADGVSCTLPDAKPAEQQ